MGSNIYLIKDDSRLVEMKEEPYNSEDLLQELLERYPNLLAGDQMDNDSPRRWLLVKREISLASEEEGSGRWSVDHLFLDQDGIPTLVEVKRSTDTRIRREVVGQMLDYAANAVVYWPTENLRAHFEENCEQRNEEPEQVLSSFLASEESKGEFWQKVKTNLQAGKIRLVFVADKIPRELKRIIEFLNGQMDPAEVLGVAISQFVGENHKTLVPRVVGQTEEAQKKKSIGSRPSIQWDEPSFFETLKSKYSEDEVNVARRILDWMKTKASRLYWGKGSRSGSCTLITKKDGIEQIPVALWTYGTVEIEFQYLKNKPPFENRDLRIELLNHLNKIRGVRLTEEMIDRRPTISFGILKDEKVLKQFIETMEWVVERINKV
ncbi:MAG: hypothetical protein AB2L14_35035 [Candidatus Xenobiia bacterium LiM19]